MSNIINSVRPAMDQTRSGNRASEKNFFFIIIEYYLPILGVPKYVLLIPYLVYLGMHFNALNMAKWGIPENILQNAVQMR